MRVKDRPGRVFRHPTVRAWGQRRVDYLPSHRHILRRSARCRGVRATVTKRGFGRPVFDGLLFLSL